MATIIQIRRDSSTNWTTNNPVLAQGEVGWEMNTSKYKIGDGVTAWNNLSYIEFGQVPNNGKLTIQKNGTTIAEFTANQSGDTTANIVADSPVWGNITGTLSNQTDLNTALGGKENTISDLSTIRNGAGAGATALQPNDVINDLTHIDTNKPLAANQGKLLNDRLNNVEGRGRFLSVWVPATGLPETDPEGKTTGDTYTYAKGDYYIVGTVATGTHYKPSGSSYVVGTASTAVETGDVKENDTYIYDGSQWILLHNTQAEVTFSNIAGQPTDNTNLAAALNGKQNTIDSTHKLGADLVDDTNTTNKFVTAGDITNWNGKLDANATITAGTHSKITYDTKGLVTGGSDLALSDLGVTATASELNTLDGITATTQELNYTDGVTSNIQTQLDGKVSDVQINGTSSVVSGVANIPVASSSDLGVVKVDGTTITITNGVISSAGGSDGLDTEVW